MVLMAGFWSRKRAAKTNNTVVVGLLSYAATMLDLHAGSKILHPLQLSAPPIISRYYKVWPPSHFFLFLLKKSKSQKSKKEFHDDTNLGFVSSIGVRGVFLQGG